MANLTIEQFGAIIKAKYPQYANISDKEVGEKMLAKYPQYQNQIALPTKTKEEGESGFGGFATGVTKSLISTSRNVAGALQKVGQKVLAGITPGETYEDIRANTGFKSIDNATPEGSAVKEILKPKGTAEKAGALVSDIAQFAIPGTKVGSLTKEAGFLAKTGAQVASDVAVNQAQTGGDIKSGIDTAILSAIIPVAGKGLGGVKNILKNPENGARIVNSLIKPLLKDLSYGKNPGRAIAEEGIVASNLDELSAKISERKNAVGDQISLVLSTPEAQAKRLDLTNSLKPIDDAIEQAQKSPRTNAALIERLQNAKKDILGVVDNADGTVSEGRALTDLTPLEATGFKRDIGDITKFTGNASDDNIINGALKRVYGNIKGLVDAAVPEVMPLNERYADLISAKIATDYRDKILERQNLVAIGEKTVGLTTALVTAIQTGGAAVPTLLYGLGATGLTRLLRSPGVKTRVASWMAEASPAVKTEFFKKAPWARAVIIRSLVGE